MPFPIPSQNPHDEPFAIIKLNSEWLLYLLGALEHLLDRDLWEGTPAQQQDAVAAPGRF